MAGVHTPALLSSWRGLVESGFDPDRIGGFAGLALTMLFFMAKIRGVKALEFATHRRAVLTIAVAVVLIHAGCINTYLETQPVPATVPVAATTLLAAGLTRVEEAFGAAWSGPAKTSKRHQRLSPSLDAAWFDVLRRHRSTMVACLCAPRAPPA
jgi:hypothetical protein